MPHVKSVAPHIPCPTCKGNGSIELPDHLQRTLSLLRKLRRATEPKIQSLMKDNIGATGFNNRIETLISYGMVARERNGRAWVYLVL